MHGLTTCSIAYYSLERLEIPNPDWQVTFPYNSIIIIQQTSTENKSNLSTPGCLCDTWYNQNTKFKIFEKYI